jgi:hypothetical protein
MQSGSGNGNGNGEKRKEGKKKEEKKKKSDSDCAFLLFFLKTEHQTPQPFSVLGPCTTDGGVETFFF